MNGPLDEETLTVIETFRDLAPANIAMGLLQARGIEAKLQGDALIGIAWHLSNAVGGVKLLVPRGQSESARKILAESIAASARSFAEEAEESESLEPDTAAAVYGEALAGSRSASPVDEDAGDEDAADRAQPGPGDALAESAWKASLLGLVIFPPALHLWSIHLLRQMRLAGGARTARGKKVASRAAITNFVVLCAASAFLLRWLAERS